MRKTRRSAASVLVCVWDRGGAGRRGARDGALSLVAPLPGGAQGDLTGARAGHPPELIRDGAHVELRPGQVSVEEGDPQDRCDPGPEAGSAHRGGTASCRARCAPWSGPGSSGLAGAAGAEGTVDASVASFWTTFGAAFVTVFVAELGDKTQLAALGLSAGARHPLAVLLGSSAALVAASALAVAVGQALARWIDLRLLHHAGGVLFVVLGVVMLARGPAPTEASPGPDAGASVRPSAPASRE